MKMKIFILLLGFLGYSILLLINWKIAIAVFLIHWSINGQIMVDRNDFIKRIARVIREYVSRS